MPLPEITEDLVSNNASTSAYTMGYDYFEGEAVKKVWVEKEAYKAHVQGSKLYTVVISKEDEEILTACSCPYEWGTCKHIVAVMLSILNGSEIEEQKRTDAEIKTLIESVDIYRLKQFLLETLNANDALLKDFRIFARGKRETEKKVETYKDEILARFEKLKGIEYYDDYYEDYNSPVGEIVGKYKEAAGKYSSQENYREAIKIYQGICEACVECFENDNLEDFIEDIHFSANAAIGRMAEVIAVAVFQLEEKRVYLDYLLKRYKVINNPAVYKDVFLKTVSFPEEADYILNRRDVELLPPIRFNLLIVKGEFEEITSYGEKHYKEYSEMAVPLSGFYLKQGFRDKAVNVAEKAIEIIEGKRKEDYYDFYSSDCLEELREFLESCYDRESDYSRKVENLIFLVKLKRDVVYYQKLRDIIKAGEEREAVIERLTTLLEGDPETLFKIYSKENDFERMLKLAAASINAQVFHDIVKKIRDKYPFQSFELYRKKIDAATSKVGKRGEYRQIAQGLKLMRDIPGVQGEFRNYIEHLRLNYKRRHAFIEEIKGI